MQASGAASRPTRIATHPPRLIPPALRTSPHDAAVDVCHAPLHPLDADNVVAVATGSVVCVGLDVDSFLIAAPEYHVYAAVRADEVAPVRHSSHVGKEIGVSGDAKC